MIIKLIVGLGNPGVEYCETRHNAGAWFVRHLAENYKTILRKDTKFQGSIGSFTLNAAQECKLFLPNAFMNLSGSAVKKLAHYYKIPTDSILVAHDDLDFVPGDMRLKFGGGHGGHKGLQSLIEHLGSDKFYRLRIGIGHPGHKELVTSYVLGRPSINEKKQILASLEKALDVMPKLLEGDFEKAQQALHTLDH